MTYVVKDEERYEARLEVVDSALLLLRLGEGSADTCRVEAEVSEMLVERVSEGVCVDNALNRLELSCVEVSGRPLEVAVDTLVTDSVVGLLWKVVEDSDGDTEDY
jgi:hypothetical protein